MYINISFIMVHLLLLFIVRNNYDIREKKRLNKYNTTTSFCIFKMNNVNFNLYLKTTLLRLSLYFKPTSLCFCCFVMLLEFVGFVQLIES